jgi:integrase
MSASPPRISLGRRRFPAAVPGYLTGRPPWSKGRRYPVDSPRTEEVIAVMRCCGDGRHGDRARGLIVVLWRAGLRIQEALDLAELDLDPRRGSVLVRCGKGGRRREVGMDDWGFEQLEPWLRARETLPGRVGERRPVSRGVADCHLVSSRPPSIRACGSPAHGSPTFFTVGIQRARCRG